VESSTSKHARTEKANRQNGTATDRVRRNGEAADTPAEQRGGGKADKNNKTEKQDKLDKTDKAENEDLDRVDGSEVQDKTESDDCNDRRPASADEDEDADYSTGTSQGELVLSCTLKPHFAISGAFSA